MPNTDIELREEVLKEFQQAIRLAPADYAENCTNVVMSMVKQYTQQRVVETLNNVSEPTIVDIELDNPASYEDTIKVVRWYKNRLAQLTKKEVGDE